jgi:hypothetical protein
MFISKEPMFEGATLSQLIENATHYYINNKKEVFSSLLDIYEVDNGHKRQMPLKCRLRVEDIIYNRISRGSINLSLAERVEVSFHDLFMIAYPTFKRG